MVKILLADDHGMFRDSMAVWLQQYSDKTEIIFAYDKISLFKQIDDSLDLIMLDLGMPDMAGAISIANIKITFPDIPILVVSANEDRKTIMACSQMGADGYITKSSDGQTILDAVSQVLSGQSFFPDIDNHHDIAAGHETLSQRQYELLSLLAEGKSNRKIAEIMHLSEGTVKQYVSQLLDILDVDNRTQAGNKAREILGV